MDQMTVLNVTKRNHFLENTIIFIVMGILYMGIELLWRGYTFFSMGIVGGLAGLSIGLINEYYPNIPLIQQGILGTVFVLVIEFASGLFLNIWLNLNMWDYSQVPLNLMGQVCLSYALFWFLLVFPCIFLDDLLRVVLFRKEKRKYKLVKN